VPCLRAATRRGKYCHPQLKLPVALGQQEIRAKQVGHLNQIGIGALAVGFAHRGSGGPGLPGG
jgi:hypothetical protein